MIIDSEQDDKTHLMISARECESEPVSSHHRYRVVKLSGLRDNHKSHLDA